jgi:hypothetical protein
MKVAANDRRVVSTAEALLKSGAVNVLVKGIQPVLKEVDPANNFLSFRVSHARVMGSTE